MLKCLEEINPSIIHVHHYANLSPSIFLAILRHKKKNKVKVIHSVHTFEYVCSNESGFDYKQNRRCTDCLNSTYKFKIFKRKCSRSGFFHSYGKGLKSFIFSSFMSRGVVDFWTVPSNFLRMKMLQQPYINEKDILVLRNPIIRSEVENVKNESVFTFVYFGRLSKEKNIDLIIKAFSRITEFESKLLIIGKGEEENQLRLLANTLNVSDNIEFINFLSKEKLIEKLNTCNVSVLSSKCYETASMVVVESLESNLLPLVCNHGGMKEMIEVTNVGLTFESDNEKDLYNKMVYSYSNYEELKKELIIRKEESLKVFSEESYFVILKVIYNKL